MTAISYTRQHRRFSPHQAVAAIFAACALFYGCLVHPLQSQLHEIQTDLALLTTRLTKKNSIRNRLAESEAMAEGQQREFRRLLSLLPENPLDLLQELQRLASADNIDMGWHTAGRLEETVVEQERSDIALQSITIQLKGEYKGLRNFLDSLSCLDQIVGIGRFDIQHARRGAPTVQAMLVLQLPFPEGNNDGGLETS